MLFRCLINQGEAEQVPPKGTLQFFYDFCAERCKTIKEDELRSRIFSIIVGN